MCIIWSPTLSSCCTCHFPHVVQSIQGDIVSGESGAEALQLAARGPHRGESPGGAWRRRERPGRQAGETGGGTTAAREPQRATGNTDLSQGFLHRYVCFDWSDGIPEDVI